MTFQIWSDAKSSRMSAAMTYYTMLSLAPLLMIAIAVATQVYCSDQVKAEIMQNVRDVASPQVAETVAGLLENTTTTQSGLIAGTISLMILLYGASGIFSQLFDTFNDIWNVPNQTRKGLRFSIRNRLVGVVMVLMVGGLLIGTLALGSVIAYINQLLDGNYPTLTSWLSLADRGLSFILMPFVLSLMFWYFPARKMKWMDVWPAAGLTAALLSGSRYSIDLYLRVSTASEVYGAAGSLVMLLVWVYLTGMILFFGAAFSCAWTKLFGSHSKLQSDDQTLDHSLLKGMKLDTRKKLAVSRLGNPGNSIRPDRSSTPLPSDQLGFIPKENSKFESASGANLKRKSQRLDERNVEQYENPPDLTRIGVGSSPDVEVPYHSSHRESYNQHPVFVDARYKEVDKSSLTLTPLRRPLSDAVPAESKLIQPIPRSIVARPQVLKQDSVPAPIKLKRRSA